LPSPDYSDIDPILNVGSLEINEQDLLNAINDLDNNTSIDNDNVCNFFLKKCSTALISPLLLIFNKSLSQGYCINSWKISSVKPTFKSGFKNLIKNYRQISQENVIPKLLDKTVTTKILSLVQNSISPFQHGFIRGRSITTNLVCYTN
jgi:hypothetical protein